MARSPMVPFWLVALVAVIVTGAPAHAQQQDYREQLGALAWQVGPTNGALGTIASIPVPSGYRFLGRGEAGKFLELNENPTDGSELGLLLKDDGAFFVIFKFSADGYVKDDDRELDADAILESIKKGTAQSNEVRRQRGWGTVDVVGWHQTPFYDPQTNHLTWAVRARSDSGESINHSTRLLGRSGVMKVNLVLSPEDVGTAVPAFNQLLTSFSYNPGQRYAEFTRGDKVAEYGLTGLIVGGAGVALLKTGLLQKFWKVIVLAFIALAGAIKRFLGGLGRRRESIEQPADV